MLNLVSGRGDGNALVGVEGPGESTSGGRGYWRGDMGAAVSELCEGVRSTGERLRFGVSLRGEPDSPAAPPPDMSPDVRVKCDDKCSAALPSG